MARAVRRRERGAVSMAPARILGALIVLFRQFVDMPAGARLLPAFRSSSSSPGCGVRARVSRSAVILLDLVCLEYVVELAS
jgi:hypothetical protein